MAYDLNLLQKRLNNTHFYHRLFQHTHQSLLDKLSLFAQPPKTILVIGFANTHIDTKLSEQYPQCDIQTLGFFKTLTPNWQKNFPEKQFDLVLLDHCLHWHSDPEKLFEQIHQILIEEGILLFSTFGPDSFKELRETFNQVDQYPHVNLFIDMHHIGDMLVKTHYNDPVMDVERYDLQYPNALELMRDIKTTGQQNCHIDRQKTLAAKQLIQQVLHQYPYNNDNDKVSASLELVFGHAIGRAKSHTSKMNKQNEAVISVDQILKRTQ